VRTRHRDYYTALAKVLDEPGAAGRDERVERAETEIDNLRAAFAWCLENSDYEHALHLASSLQPLWSSRGRVKEGLDWLDAVLADDTFAGHEIPPRLRARALADRAGLKAYTGATDSTDPEEQLRSIVQIDQADQALAIAREIDDAALLLRALTSRGSLTGYNVKMAEPYFAEAVPIAREIGDGWRLSQILGWQAFGNLIAGDPNATCAKAQEGRDLADSIGDRFNSRLCRFNYGWGQWALGGLHEALSTFEGCVAEAVRDHDLLAEILHALSAAHTLAYLGRAGEAREIAEKYLLPATEFGGINAGLAYAALRVAALAAGAVDGALSTSEAAWQHIRVAPDTGAVNVSFLALTALADGDVTTARRWAEQAVASTTGWHRSAALTTRALVAVAERTPEQAERDAHDALAIAAGLRAYLGVADALECLGGLAPFSAVNGRKS
jgi:hypothetical protein